MICDWNGKLTRLQVKSTNSLSDGRRYQVEAVNGGDKTPYEEGVLDYFIVHVIPEETWYIIPYSFVSAKKIVIYPNNPDSNAKYEIFKDAWYLLK